MTTIATTETEHAGWPRVWGTSILGAFLGAAFVLNGLADTFLRGAATPAGGSMKDRIAIGLFFAAAVPLGWSERHRVLRLLARNMPLVALLGWLAASALWSLHPDLTVRRAAAYVMVCSAFLIVAAVIDAADFLVCLVTVFAALALADLVVTVVVPARTLAFDVGEPGQAGIFGDKNTAGTMSLIAVVVLSFGVAAARSVWVQGTLAALLAGTWIFLYETHSKTSFGVALGLLLIAPVALASIRGGLRSTVVLGIAFLAGGSATLLTLGFAGATPADLMLAVFRDLTFSRRTEIWSAVLHEIGRHPFLGTGFGAFWDAGGPLNPFHDVYPDSYYRDAAIINEAHNGYLDALLQVGVVGLLLEAVVCAQGLWNMFAALKTRGAPAHAAALAAGLAVAVLLNNLLESYVFRPSDLIGYLFVLLLFMGSRLRADLAAADAGAARSPAWSTERQASVPHRTGHLAAETPSVAGRRGV